MVPLVILCVADVSYAIQATLYHVKNAYRRIPVHITGRAVNTDSLFLFSLSLFLYIPIRWFSSQLDFFHTFLYRKIG